MAQQQRSKRGSTASRNATETRAEGEGQEVMTVEKDPGGPTLTIPAIKPADPEAFPTVQRGRTREPNPFDDTVQNASDGEAFTIENVSKDDADKYAKLLRASASHFKRFARVRLTDDGQFWFKITHKPARSTTYTSEQIREWATKAGLPTVSEGSNRIPKETREAFWQAVKAEEQRLASQGTSQDATPDAGEASREEATSDPAS